MGTDTLLLILELLLRNSSGIATSLLAETGKSLCVDPIDDPELAGYTVVWGQSPKPGAAQTFGTNPKPQSLRGRKTYYMAVQGVDKQVLPESSLKKKSCHR
jgi:hypothetical protein